MYETKALMHTRQLIAGQDHVNPRKSDMVSMRSSIAESMNSWDSIYQPLRRAPVDVCVGLGRGHGKGQSRTNK